MDNKNLVYCQKCGKTLFRNMGGSISYEQHHGSYLYQIPIGTQVLNHSCGQEGILEVKNMGTIVEIHLAQIKGS